MRTKTTLLLALSFILSIAFSMAQDFKPTDKLPQDPSVITGELKNGIKYYIRQNAKPEIGVDYGLG
jgi:hypothetical protein